MGPFLRAKGDLRNLLVAIDYMTKWAEAKVMRTINRQDCIRFIKGIIMHYGLPRFLVSDNGPQFAGIEIKDFSTKQGIQYRRSSVAYPQSNRQAEVINRTLLRGIEKRLNECKIKWPEELRASFGHSNYGLSQHRRNTIQAHIWDKSSITSGSGISLLPLPKL